jgi:hypothetical protein
MVLKMHLNPDLNEYLDWIEATPSRQRDKRVIKPTQLYRMRSDGSHLVVDQWGEDFNACVPYHGLTFASNESVFLRHEDFHDELRKFVRKSNVNTFRIRHGAVAGDLNSMDRDASGCILLAEIAAEPDDHPEVNFASLQQATGLVEHDTKDVVAAIKWALGGMPRDPGSRLSLTDGLGWFETPVLPLAVRDMTGWPNASLRRSQLHALFQLATARSATHGRHIALGTRTTEAEGQQVVALLKGTPGFVLLATPAPAVPPPVAMPNAQDLMVSDQVGDNEHRLQLDRCRLVHFIDMARITDVGELQFRWDPSRSNGVEVVGPYPKDNMHCRNLLPAKPVSPMSEKLNWTWNLSQCRAAIGMLSTSIEYLDVLLSPSRRESVLVVLKKRTTPPVGHTSWAGSTWTILSTAFDEADGC